MSRFLPIFLIALILLTGCTPAPGPDPAAVTTGPSSSHADLEGIKDYLLAKVEELQTSAAALQQASQSYHKLAESVNFDYALLSANPAEAASALSNAKDAWLQASPLYEQMEGIVAGVPSLSAFDVLLDAGASGAEDPANAAPYDLALPDGRIFERPGNLFGVLESALWGTEPAFTALPADLDGSGAVEFGEALPDAELLLAAAGLLVEQSAALETAAQAWQPSESDAFTALVVMVPTMNEYFNSWKASRFVSGEASTQRDFVAISRLADIQDILSSLQVVYQGIRPLAETASFDQAGLIEQSLDGLKAFVADIHSQELGGRRYTAEEADLLGAEAQNRATSLAGQISQIAAQLDIRLAE